MFRRELAFDCPPYHSSGDPADGYILTDAEGRGIGGCTVRWQEYENAAPRWVLSWIWIAPAYRRNGLMRQTWEMVKSRYEGIEPDPPFSRPAAMFFRHREDVPDRIRAWAEHATIVLD